MLFGDSFFSRLERFKEITESTTNFDEERARLVLGELEDILNKEKLITESGINPDISMPDRIAFREVLELTMILNVRTSNYEDIRKYYEQLKFFYFYDDELPQSQRMFMLIVLSLLVDLYLESSKFKKLNSRQNIHSKSTSKNIHNHDSSNTDATSDEKSKESKQTETSNELENDPSKNSEINNNSDSLENEDDQISKGYYIVDFKENYFQIDLAEVQKRFQSHENLYLDFILNVDTCIRNNSIQSLYDIPNKSPSVLFDDMLCQIYEGIRWNISINILSCSLPCKINQIKNLLNFKTIEECRQFLQSLRCRISEDGTVTAPGFLRLNKNRHTSSPHSIAFKKVTALPQSSSISLSRSNSGNFNPNSKNYSDDEQDSFYEIDNTLDIYHRFYSLSKK